MEMSETRDRTASGTEIDQAAGSDEGKDTGKADPRRHPGRLGESGESGVAPAVDRPNRPGRGMGGRSGGRPVGSRTDVTRTQARRERAYLRAQAYRRLVELRRAWEEIGLVADRRGWAGVVRMAEQSEDRIGDAMRAMERQAREVDRVCDDEPRHEEWMRDHRERVEAMDDPDDPVGDDDAGDGSGDDLRRPADLAGLLGMLRPGVSPDMRVW